MKLSKSKIILSLIANVSLLSMSCIAKADNINISNASDHDISFKINGTCSQEFGVVKAKTIKIIPEASIINACSYNPQACSIEVYRTPNCGDRFGFVASIAFDATHGLKTVLETGGIAKVICNGFNLFFENW